MSGIAGACLLDTNVCIELLRGNPKISQALSRRTADTVHLCSVVISELTFCACNSEHVTENLTRLQRFRAAFLSLPFDDRAAAECGQIRTAPRKYGGEIGVADIYIAAIARVHDLTLVTHNTREFSHVAGLSLEDWQA